MTTESEAGIDALFARLVAGEWDWSSGSGPRDLRRLRQAVLDAQAGRLDDAGLLAVARQSVGSAQAAEALAEQCRAVIRQSDARGTTLERFLRS